MSSDTKSKIIRRNNKSKKMDELSRRRKKNEQSDDSDNNFSSDSESDEMDAVEYQKFLSTMFPSKHLNKKIKVIKFINDQMQRNFRPESFKTQCVSKF